MCSPHYDVSEHLLSWMDNSEKPSSSHAHPSVGSESVPALEVPLSNVQFQEDEMLSWLQYPLEDSFDKNYCSEELNVEAPISHSNFVHDAFSNLTLRDSGKLHSAGLRSQSSSPSAFNFRETDTGGDAPTAMRAWEVAGHCDTNKGERVLAANTAMAMGAQRAAGLLFQSGAEAFNTVRTTAQPYTAKRVNNVLPTQETGRSASNFFPYALKVRGARSGLQPPFQRLTSPNFPLFSRAAGVTKTSLQQIAYNNSTGNERAKLAFATEGKGGDSRFDREQISGEASPTLQAHPTVATTERSSEAFGASSATGDTGMGSSRLPFQSETKRRPFVTHLKDAFSTSVTESTKTGTISRKLEAETVDSTHVEGTSLSALCAKRGLPSAAAVSPGLASGPFVGCIDSMPKIEMGRQYRMSQKGDLFSCAESTATTDMDSSMYSELSCHESEATRSLIRSGVFSCIFTHSNRSELGAGEDLDSNSKPVMTVSGFTTSESKLCETVEGGDFTMTSPSRGSGDSTEKSVKETADCTMKRRAHPAEDSEIESEVVPYKDGKLPQGRARGGKRARAAETHNLSERKRRNRINFKMKALQDLVPNANKTDKASILDEAIEYMKLLQSQVQLMSLRSGMGGLPMVVPPGIPSASMQQRLLPPHLNMDLTTGLAFRVGMGSGNLDAARVNRHSLWSDAPVVGHPLSGSAYSASALQLAGSYAGIQEAQGHSRSPGADEAYTLTPMQQQQQHLHLNTRTNADVFGAYTIQQQQFQSLLQVPAREAPSDAMQQWSLFDE